MPSVGGGANPRQDPCGGESPSAAATAAPRRAGPGATGMKHVHFHTSPYLWQIWQSCCGWPIAEQFRVQRETPFLTQCNGFGCPRPGRCGTRTACPSLADQWSRFLNQRGAWGWARPAESQIHSDRLLPFAETGLFIMYLLSARVSWAVKSKGHL